MDSPGAVQPGPFQMYLISQTLLKGWKRTLPVVFAPLISDGPIIALCLFVLSQVPSWLQRFLYSLEGYSCFIWLMALISPGKTLRPVLLTKNPKTSKVCLKPRY